MHASFVTRIPAERAADHGLPARSLDRGDPVSDDRGRFVGESAAGVVHIHWGDPKHFEMVCRRFDERALRYEAKMAARMEAEVERARKAQATHAAMREKREADFLVWLRSQASGRAAKPYRMNAETGKALGVVTAVCEIAMTEGTCYALAGPKGGVHVVQRRPYAGGVRNGKYGWVHVIRNSEMAERARRAIALRRRST